MYIWNQHEFVGNCIAWYKKADLTPGNPEDGIWHKAHYPVPKCLGGTDWIWLLKEHHAVQGVLQSMEYEHCCLGGWEKHCLTGYWEYLLPLFITICGERGRKNLTVLHNEKDESGRSVFGVITGERLNQEKDGWGRSVNAVKGGVESGKNGKGALCRTPEQMTQDGRRGGSITKNKGLGIFAPGQQLAGGNAVSKQKWECTVTGKISAAGPLTGWQKARGIDVSNRVRRRDLE
jgi:hypothetical protein